MDKIQRKIDLENIKFNSVIPLYKDLPKDIKPRKKTPLIQYWFLNKAKKQEINEARKLESEFNEWQDIKSKHDERIRKLTYKQARYNVYFPKKEPKVKPIEDAKNEPIFHYDHTKNSNWFLHPIISFKKWWWRTWEKETVLLINMQLNNGKHISFIRKIEDERFSIFDGTFIIDLKLSYYSLSAEMYCLDYHQAYPLPIKRNWDVDGIKSAIESSGIIDCPSATNPSNIARFLNSNIIEQIFQGASLGKLLMAILIISVVSLCGVIISIIVIMNRMGALEKLIGK